MMTLEVLEAFLSKNKVYLKEPEKLMELREKAFGTLADNKLFLSPYEAFYLVEKRRAHVTDEKTGKEKTLQNLVTKLSTGKATIWTKYLVYRDLRDRGYLVRESEEGFDFEPSEKEPPVDRCQSSSKEENPHSKNLQGSPRKRTRKAKT